MKKTKKKKKKRCVTFPFEVAIFHSSDLLRGILRDL